MKGEKLKDGKKKKSKERRKKVCLTDIRIESSSLFHYTRLPRVKQPHF